MTRKTKLRTNEDLVRDLMNYSPFGALAQGFIMQAIRDMADQVAAQDPAKSGSAMLSGDAWVGVAKDIKERCDAFYSR